MCGFVGFLTRKHNLQDAENALEKMTSVISHRGPDQNGKYLCENSGVYLAHQRLSIHDLSELGRQPMVSDCGGYTLVFNGEIYNYKQIRKDLSSDFGVRWKSSSDTEVLLACLIKRGIESTLKLVNGMFSFALFDRVNGVVYLARDRFGEKPLYLYTSLGEIVFASELKPIEVYGANLTLNSDAISTQLKYSYIPAPYSIYREVQKLPAAHYVSIKLNKESSPNIESAVPYWNILDEVEKAKKEKVPSLEEAISKVECDLTRSVRLRMDADVPYGAFLSGGIDSTVIATLMQNESRAPIDTFSIGFDDSTYNEADHAKEVAGIIGTNHHELILKPKDIIEIVPSLSKVYDEPFSDSSQLPTIAVSKFARKSVTVALTGDAGDELFAGYNRHKLAPQFQKRVFNTPESLRKLASRSIKSIRPSFYDQFSLLLKRVLGKKGDIKGLGDKLHKFAKTLSVRDERELYQTLIETGGSSQSLVVTGKDLNQLSDLVFKHKDLSISEKMMIQDTLSYMQHDILTKVDRASMSVSLEARVPFLDNDVFSTAWSLPFEYKCYKGKTKYPLRQIIAKYVPDELMQRPKTGFGIPIYEWLRTDLRDWANQLLEDALQNEEIDICSNSAMRIWNEHQSGAKNHQYALWNLLMLQQWFNSKS